MNGTESYNTLQEKRIQNVLNNNPEYLTGFYYYICNKYSLVSIYNYLNCVVRFMKMVNKQVEELSLDDFIMFLSTLKNKTSSSQRFGYYGLKDFCEYLYVSEKIKRNYMDTVAIPKRTESLETKQRRAKSYLNEKEIEEYVENVRYGIGTDKAISFQETWKERDIAIIYLFLTTGMRASALFKLDINNINLKEKTLVTIDKGNKVNDYVLSDVVVEALNKWIAKRKEFLNGKEETALFISNQKTRISHSAISRIVKKYSVGIKEKPISPHKLRATFGTQLYKETRDIKFVQDRMGHANPQTTELYIRYDQTEDKKKSAAIMSRFLN